MVISCGKKPEDDEGNTVTTTPPATVEDKPGQEIQSESFSVSVSKDEIQASEALIITVKNIGKINLVHSLFSFATEPSASVVSNLNCYSEMQPDDECVFSVMFNNPKIKHHKVTVIYDESNTNVRVQLNIKVLVDEEQPEIHFLYRKNHTFADCEKLYKWGGYGVVKSIHFDDFCSLRAEHWNSPKRVQIEKDPLKNYSDPILDANEHYCAKDWTIDSFQFEAAEVEHVKNIFGSKEWVTIPPGESREICVKRGLLDVFKCKHKKVFYSRLVSVNCY